MFTLYGLSIKRSNYNKNTILTTTPWQPARGVANKASIKLVNIVGFSIDIRYWRLIGIWKQIAVLFVIIEPDRE